MDEIYHHGVKGMRWGHHKARPNVIARHMQKRRADDSRAKKVLGKHGYEIERDIYGRKGANRIAKRMKQKGMSRRRAEFRESGRQAAKAALTTMSAIAVTGLAVAAKHKSRGNNALNVIKDMSVYDLVGSVDGVDILNRVR